MHVDHIPGVVAAACILHNMRKIHGEQFNDAWLQDISRVEGDSSQPPTVVQPKRVCEALVPISSIIPVHTHV